MANHEPFNDHLMRNWQLSGPERGVGSKARVTISALGPHRPRRHRGHRRRARRRASSSATSPRRRAARARAPTRSSRFPPAAPASPSSTPGSSRPGRPPHRAAGPRLHPPQQRHRHAPPRRTARGAQLIAVDLAEEHVAGSDQVDTVSGQDGGDPRHPVRFPAPPLAWSAPTSVELDGVLVVWRVAAVKQSPTTTGPSHTSPCTVARGLQRPRPSWPKATLAATPAHHVALALGWCTTGRMCA